MDHSEGLKEFMKIFGLAFSAATGLTFLFLACALPEYDTWYPMIVLLFYLGAPLPLMLAFRATGGYRTGTTTTVFDWAIFSTMFFVVPSFGLPVLFARCPDYQPLIQWGACYLTMSGNVIMYITLIFFGFYIYKGNDYFMW